MFSKFFINRPRFAIVISIVLSLAGLIALYVLPIALYPSITPPEIVVSASYPGASADVVAKTVGIPLEDAVNGVEDMLYMSSSSRDGNYSLTVTFNTGVDPDIAQVKVQNRISQNTSKLPAEVTRSGVTVRRRSSDHLGSIVFISPTGQMSRLEMSDYLLNNVSKSLGKLNGVGEISVYGSKLSMRVWLNADKMAALNIPISTVRSAITSQNYQPSLGKIGALPNEGDEEMVYALQTTGRINEVDDFKNIIVRTSEQGGLVLLRDIATVEAGQESYGIDVEYNGTAAASLSINLTSGANALDTMKLVKAELARIAQFFPKDMTYVINYDSTLYITESITEVVWTLILTFILVVAVCYLFLQDWRSTLIPSLTIPVSLLATFAVMLAFGYSLNMFTLFGLLLAIGVVVDDAIVVVERVIYLMDSEKMDARQATIQTMEEVSGALIATTLVLLAIFVPIAFMGGITGKIYMEFAVTISVAVCFSTLNAMTLSPALCSTILKPTKPANNGFLGWFNRVVKVSHRKYASRTSFIARKVKLIGLIFFAFLLITLGLLKISKTSFIPAEDQGMMSLNMQLPEGASFKRTKEVMERVRPIIEAEEGVRSVMTIIGSSMSAGTAENLGRATIVLKPWNERTSSSLYSTNILNRLRAKLSNLPDAEMQFMESPPIRGLGNAAGLDFRLQALDDNDYNKLDMVMQNFMTTMSESPEINYSYSMFTAETPNIYLDIDRAKAEIMQVPISNIFSTIENYLGSGYVNDINFGTQANRVVIQSDWKYRKDVSSVYNLHVPSIGGNMVPLKALVNLKHVLSPRIVTRYNQYPSANITAIRADDVSSQEAISAVEEMAKNLPEGYAYEWSGMSYQEKNNQGTLGYLLVLAVLFAYLFLVAQYESFTVPISVLLSIVTAMMGALIGLFISGLTLSIYAQLGLVLLIGLSSKNAILIVEFASVEHKKGATIVGAALTGLRERFRAVLMTAFTFILGVLPMIFATGAGAASRRAIGVPVFYGMLIGTVVGLLVIPLLYVLVQTMVDRFTARSKNKTTID